MGMTRKAIYIHMLPHSSHDPDTSYVMGTYGIYTCYPISSLIIIKEFLITILPIKMQDSGNMHELPKVTQPLAGRTEIWSAGLCLLFKQRHLFIQHMLLLFLQM